MIRRFFLIFVAAMIMTVTGCSTHKGLVFADREWHISEYYGQIIDSDTTWRMTFGNVLIPEDLTVISCADSMARYPGMERFISDILHTIGLDSAEILFYAPHMQTMFVIPKGTTPAGRPSSVSVTSQTRGHIQCGLMRSTRKTGRGLRARCTPIHISTKARNRFSS